MIIGISFSQVIIFGAICFGAGCGVATFLYFKFDRKKRG